MQGCHGQGKNLENGVYFQVREMSGNFVDGQGNLVRTRKVREMSGNLKINGCGSLQKNYMFCSLGKDVLFHETV